MISLYAGLVSRLEQIVSKYTGQSASVSGVRATLNLVRETVAYAYLVYLVTSSRLGVSDFIFYFGIITGFSNWIMSFVYCYSNIERCCHDCEAYRSFVEETDEQSADGKKADFAPIEQIEFKNVSFRYPEADSDTIHNMSFTVKKGENIAIVGENGAGKTTFIKLLCRLYDPDEGEILINGTDIRQYKRESLLKLFSPVFQDFAVFAFSVFENLSASDEYDSEKLNRALKEADILERVEKMPQREKTYLFKSLDKNGVDISGGEQQKIALARALYKDSPVVVLDEPTAALDPIAEHEIYSRFNSFTKDKTAIYISHRLSSCVFCDRVAVFDKAKLVETGTHRELLDKDGQYAALWNAQAQHYC